MVVLVPSVEVSMVKKGTYHSVVRLDVTVSAVAVTVFPTASLIAPLTSTETLHVTVSPLEGVLPSWPVDMGREISALPV